MKEFFRCLTGLMLFFFIAGIVIILSKDFCESYGAVNKLTTNLKDSVCYVNVNNKDVNLTHYLLMKKWDL